MKIKLQREKRSTPKKGFLLGTYNSVNHGAGIGIGCSYYDDGLIDVGFTFGKHYHNLEISWGEAEQNSAE